MNTRLLNELINRQVNEFVETLIIDEYLKGIKMGRIPKAEKEKAIEVLRNSDEIDEELKSMLDEEEAESSYSKRFEKRLELDKNLKILAENVLKSCGETPPSTSSSLSQPDGNNNNEISSPNVISHKETAKESTHSNASCCELITINDTMDTTIDTNLLRKKIRLDIREDFMSRFLMVLFEKMQRLNELQIALVDYNALEQLNQSSSNATNRSNNILIKSIRNFRKPLKFSTLIPKTVYCDLFMNSFHLIDSNHFLISSLLNDKVFQVYNEHTKNINYYYDRAKELVKNPALMAASIQQQAELTIEKVWSSVVESIPEFVKTVVSFSKEIPGLNGLKQTDIATIINNKLFDFFVISNSILFINGDSYLHLPNNIRYTRYWMGRVKTHEIIDQLFDFVADFNKLFLTAKEKALLIVLLFTMPDVDGIEDLEALRDLNEYYTRAILYEFDVNKRDLVFMKNFKNVLVKIKENRALQASVE